MRTLPSGLPDQQLLEVEEVFFHADRMHPATRSLGKLFWLVGATGFEPVTPRL